MSARSSEPRRGRGPLARVRNERGSVVVLVAVGMVVILCGAAFALEFGRAYLSIQRLSRAVDAGALAAARVMRMGQTGATAQAMAVAAANGVANGKDGVHLSVAYKSNAKGQMTVEMTARRPLPMILGRLMGREELALSSSAVAASPPVDLMMVIDQSASLADADAWDDLQDAAKTFVDYFGAGYDQLGLVSFHTRAVDREKLSKDFKSKVKTRINGMASFGNTNMSEGLRLAQVELKSTRAQPGSLKAVIFFTDGKPNTLRAVMSGKDRIIYAAASEYYGTLEYFDNPDLLPTDRAPTSTGSCFVLFIYNTCPTGWNPQKVAADAYTASLQKAAELRASGVYVYTIGMMDAKTKVMPDTAFLSRMANVDGRESASQPQARMYYAPGPEKLKEMFTRVASDLMVHLVR